MLSPAFAFPTFLIRIFGAPRLIVPKATVCSRQLKIQLAEPSLPSMDLQELLNQLLGFLSSLDTSTLRRFYNDRLDSADVETLSHIKRVSNELFQEAERLMKDSSNRVLSKDSSDEAEDEKLRSMAKRGRRAIEPSSSPDIPDTSSHTIGREENEPTRRDNNKGKPDKKVKREPSQDPGRDHPIPSTVTQELRSKSRPEHGSKSEGDSQTDKR